MSCGQCIRKVLKAAEPLTKHTLTHTHSHTKAPYTAITLTPPRQRHIQPHLFWDTHPKTHKTHPYTHRPQPAHTPRHTHVSGARATHIHPEKHKIIYCKQMHTMRQTPKDKHTHSQSQKDTLTTLGSTQIFSCLTIAIKYTSNTCTLNLTTNFIAKRVPTH